MLLRFLFFLKMGERQHGQSGEHQLSSFHISPLRCTVSQILICRASEVNLHQSIRTVTRGLSEPESLCQPQKKNRKGWCLKHTLECMR